MAGFILTASIANGYHLALGLQQSQMPAKGVQQAICREDVSRLPNTKYTAVEQQDAVEMVACQVEVMGGSQHRNRPSA
jgi:hypothetical protein